MRLPRLWFAALAAACLTSTAALAAAPTAMDFAKPPALSNVLMSPSGKRLAMLVADPKDGRLALAVLDLPPKAPPRIVASYGDADVSGVQWVNDDRLVYAAFEAGGAEIRDGGGGLFAVSHEGGLRVELIGATQVSGAQAGSRIGNRMLTSEWTFVEVAQGGSGNDIIVQEIRYTTGGQPRYGRLGRLDTVTGRLETYSVGAPPNAFNFVFDAKGEPRVALTSGEGREQMHVRKPGTDTWVKVRDIVSYEESAIYPLFLEADDQLIVRSQGGTDTWGLYVYDLKTNQLQKDPLARTARYDIGAVHFDRQEQRVASVDITTDRPQTVWFSDRVAALQKAIDGSLPAGRINRIECDACERSPFYVVRSSSDQHPGEYFVYDAEQRRLLPLGQARPGIDVQTQGKRSFHWIAARDGLQFPVVVTHPVGSDPKKPLPAVMIVHGGPWVRGESIEWEREAQFFASRGYRVLQPSFRGTTGLGAKLVLASFKQWGRTMQDDLADTVAWAGREGLVDTQRVCIYGGSYGGYAALMGPVRSPGVYRCAASLVGVTDLALMFTSNQADLTDDLRSFDMRRRIGNPDTERAEMDRNSPLHRAAEIKVPVLLAQGLLDRRVPREHADAFESAARKGGVDLERVNYPDEGHGFRRPSNWADIWQRLDAFLARSLKP